MNNENNSAKNPQRHYKTEHDNYEVEHGNYEAEHDNNVHGSVDGASKMKPVIGNRKPENTGKKE